MSNYRKLFTHKALIESRQQLARQALVAISDQISFDSPEDPSDQILRLSPKRIARRQQQSRYDKIQAVGEMILAQRSRSVCLNNYVIIDERRDAHSRSTDFTQQNQQHNLRQTKYRFRLLRPQLQRAKLKYSDNNHSLLQLNLTSIKPRPV